MLTKVCPDSDLFKLATYKGIFFNKWWFVFILLEIIFLCVRLTGQNFWQNWLSDLDRALNCESSPIFVSGLSFHGPLPSKTPPTLEFSHIYVNTKLYETHESQKYMKKTKFIEALKEGIEIYASEDWSVGCGALPEVRTERHIANDTKNRRNRKISGGEGW